MVCTTPVKVSSENEKRAKRVAAFFGVPFVTRQTRSIKGLIEEEACQVVIVMGKSPMIYHATVPSVPLFFHPSMAKLRILNLSRGQPDRLIACAQLQTGDVVVDATLGLGSDSLVFAAAVGSEGKVFGLESVPLLYHLFCYVKQFGQPKYPELQSYLSVIQPVLMDHDLWLQKQATSSVDVVYFDPMFCHPTLASPAMDSLRPFANYSMLSASSFAEAQRIARKCVIVKERTHSELFRKYDLQPDKWHGKFAYGVWRKG